MRQGRSGNLTSDQQEFQRPSQGPRDRGLDVGCVTDPCVPGKKGTGERSGSSGTTRRGRTILPREGDPRLTPVLHHPPTSLRRVIYYVSAVETNRSPSVCETDVFTVSVEDTEN